MKCGSCKGNHNTVSEVRSCYGSPAPAQATSLLDLVSEFTYNPTPWASSRQASSASPRALEYARSLFAERSVPGDRRGSALAVLEAPMPNAGDVSLLIEELKAMPDGRYPLETPAGHYATESRTGNNDLDFWVVDRPTEGRWAGYTFVSRVIGGHEDQRVRGSEARQALEAIIAAGPEQAARRYGQEIGRCGRCNRHLTDETSRTFGLGPECRTKGW